MHECIKRHDRPRLPPGAIQRNGYTPLAWRPGRSTAGTGFGAGSGKAAHRMAKVPHGSPTKRCRVSTVKWLASIDNQLRRSTAWSQGLAFIQHKADSTLWHPTSWLTWPYLAVSADQGAVYVCIYLHLCIYGYIYLSIYLMCSSIYLTTHACIYLSQIYLSMFLFIYQCIYLCIYLSMHLCVVMVLLFDRPQSLRCNYVLGIPFGRSSCAGAWVFCCCVCG